MGKHRWSGWPGAFCMYCGTFDYLEQAVGEGWFDVTTETWDTEEHRQQYEEQKNNCPHTPEGVDPYSLPYPLKGDESDD